MIIKKAYQNYIFKYPRIIIFIMMIFMSLCLFWYIRPDKKIRKKGQT